ncbi:MAG: helix-turn-helix domain-containing protein, partial [Myxococcota bacterium]
YHWPGNVRQLEHVVERALILAQGRRIERFELPTEEAETVARPSAPPMLPPADVKLQDWLLRYERQVIVAALRQAGGVQAKAARRLGVSRSNLNYRIHRLGIQVKDVEYE